MNTEYIHDPLDQPIESIAGYYTPMKELRLEHNGREVLCILGYVAVESSHYLTGGGAYALVPGYIAKWKFRESDDGKPISEVEPIKDENARQSISAAINEIEPAKIIDFW
ncbi:MAG: hypothetical protein WC455_05490 [Dehalococcoidia bacterium]|jgi:hypothetical protein